MESTTINNAIKDVRELFNELRSNLSCEETKRIRKELYKKEPVYNSLKDGLDYLFNEVNEEDYYKPTEVKSAFDGSYMLYESRGDKDAKLTLQNISTKLNLI